MSTRQMLRNSYFWPDWNYYARLGVFHTIFSSKEVTFLVFPHNLGLKIPISRFFTSVAYCTGAHEAEQLDCELQIGLDFTAK